ncbi:putative reverse transcriptase domain-containing protein [Tanacetum coccineum]
MIWDITTNTRYAVSSEQRDDKMQSIKLSRASVPFSGLLKEYGYDEKGVLKELKKLQVNSAESATSLKRLLKEKTRIKEEIKATMNEHYSTITKYDLPPKEKDPGSLGKLAATKLIIELANKIMKRPKGIAEKVLVGIDKFVFPVDFIVLDMPEDIKIPLILGRPFLSTAHAKIDVFKRKFSLRVGNEKIVFKSDSSTSNKIKKVYVLQDPEFGDFIELNDLNEQLELRNHENEDLDPKIKEGEIIDEPMVDVVKIRHDDEIVGKIDEYPSFCDYHRKIHINCAYNLQFYCMIGYEHVNANFFPILSIIVMSKSFYNSIMKEKIEYKGKNVVGTFINVPIIVGNFSIVTDFIAIENMDAYRDKDMGDVIFGKPFYRDACVEARWFDGFITIHNDIATIVVLYWMIGSWSLRERQLDIIEHLGKDSEKNMFWIINEEVRESLLNLKNTMYHSKWIRYFPKLRQDNDHCMTLKNTPYPHQQIRRIRYCILLQ